MSGKPTNEELEQRIQQLEQANIELKMRAKELQESEERHRSIWEHTSDAIFCYEYDPPIPITLTVEEQVHRMHYGKLVVCNAVAASYFGYKHPEDVVGMKVCELFSSGPGGPVDLMFNEFVRNGYRLFEVESIEALPDGSKRHYSNNAQGVVVDGYLIRVRGAYHDITERKRTEDQLRQTQKMEAVGHLAGGVAHDFNNMLGVILGHVDMANQKVDLAQPLDHHLKEIRKAADRSANLTRQLLAFARKQTVLPKVLDLNETIAGMLNLIERLIGEDIDLAWLPSSGLWSVEVDPSQIDQILANLCVNARDAITDVGHVNIATGNTHLDKAYCEHHPGSVPGDYVKIDVRDDGCGMDKAILSQIFEPFFTTKEVGKGTGLGLSTVYGIVKQNNGYINVQSEPGSGTRFTVYFHRHEGRAKQVRTNGVGGKDLRGQETILLVEDEPAILNMAKLMLEGIGYRVLAISTPIEAIRLAKKHGREIQLLLTDVVMPEMNGRELSQNILSLHPDCKCLFMSGYSSDTIAHNGVLEPSVNFIQKPFPLKELAAKIREVMDDE